MLDGVEIYELDHGIQFHGVQTKHRTRASLASSAFRAIRCWIISSSSKRTRSVTPKMTIPSPAMLHFRLEPAADRPPRNMPTATPSSTILAKTYQQAIRAFYDAGCRYLQFDDTAWAYLARRRN